MENLFQNGVITIRYDSAAEVLVVSWDRSCANILEMDLTHELAEIKSIILDRHIHKVVLDLDECQFFFTETRHSWDRDTMYALFRDLPARKLAIVVPENIFVNASFELGIISLSDVHGAVHYFKKIDQAIAWVQAA